MSVLCGNEIRRLLNIITDTSFNQLNTESIIVDCDNVIKINENKLINRKIYKVDDWSLLKMREWPDMTCPGNNILTCTFAPLFNTGVHIFDSFDNYAYALDFIRSQCNIDNMKQTIVDFDIMISEMIEEIKVKTLNVTEVTAEYYNLYQSKKKILYFFVNKEMYDNQMLLNNYDQVLEEYHDALKAAAVEEFIKCTDSFNKAIIATVITIDITTTRLTIYDQIMKIYMKLVKDYSCVLYDDLKKNLLKNTDKLIDNLWSQIEEKNSTFDLTLKDYENELDNYCLTIDRNVMQNHFIAIVYSGKSIITHDAINLKQITKATMGTPTRSIDIKCSEVNYDMKYNDDDQKMLPQNNHRQRHVGKNEICIKMFNEIKYHLCNMVNYFMYDVYIMSIDKVNVVFNNVMIVTDDNVNDKKQKRKFVSYFNDFILDHKSLYVLGHKYKKFMYEYLQFSDVPIQMEQMNYHCENHFSTICFDATCKLINNFNDMYYQTDDGEQGMYIASDNINKSRMIKLCKYVNYSPDIIEKHFKSDVWNDEHVVRDNAPEIYDTLQISDIWYNISKYGVVKDTFGQHGMKYYQFAQKNTIQKIFIDKLITCFLDQEFSNYANPLRKTII